MSKVICANCGSENPTNFKYCMSCGLTLPITETQPVTSPAAPLKNVDAVDVKKKRNFIVTAIMVAIVILAANAPQLFQKFTFNRQMTQFASEMNKQCPMMIDQITRLDNVMSLPGKIFQYNYTLVGVDKSQVDLKILEEQVFPAILNNTKTNPDMEFVRRNKVTFHYYYKDDKGVFITKYVITPEMYQ